MSAVHDGTANVYKKVRQMTKCSKCRFIDANFNAEWIHCKLFDDWIRIKDAENEELQCEGYYADLRNDNAD